VNNTIFSHIGRLKISYLPSAASGYSNVFFRELAISIVKACPDIKAKIFQVYMQKCLVIIY
jgi:hypothetical protein